MPHTASINVLDFGRLFDSKCIGIYRCQIVSKLKVLFEQLSIQVSKNFAVSQMHYLSQTIELMRKICANYISDIQSICMQTSGEILTTDIKEGKQHNSGSLAVKKRQILPTMCLFDSFHSQTHSRSIADMQINFDLPKSFFPILLQLIIFSIFFVMRNMGSLLDLQKPKIYYIRRWNLHLEYQH